MHLKDVDLVPAVIVDDKDPEKLGRIKVSCPSKFDTNTMDIEALPWVYPLTMSGYQSFYRPRRGSKVWLIDNVANYNEYWYIPLFELNADTQKLSKQYNNNDVLMSRNNGTNSLKVYGNDNEGFKMTYGDNMTIQLEPSGNINLKSPNVSAILSGEKMSVGAEGGEYEPTVLGKKLNNFLDTLVTGLTSIEPDSYSSFTLGNKLFEIGLELKEKMAHEALLTKKIEVQ